MCGGGRHRPVSTSSSASRRSTSSACSVSSVRRGHGWDSRCCRSAPSTTRSSHVRWSRGSFGTYAGGQSILVGTPSGVTLAAEGGAHQSRHHAVDRAGAAGRDGVEPAFAQTEWVPARRAVAARSVRRRVGVRPADDPPDSTRRWRPCPTTRPDARASRRARRRVPAAYGGREPDVTLVVVGAVVPEALDAADELDASGRRPRTSSSCRRTTASGVPPQARRGLLPESLAHGVDEGVLRPGLPGDAAGDGARRAPAHAGVPRQRARRRRCRASGCRASGRPAPSATCTGCTASTRERSSRRR